MDAEILFFMTAKDESNFFEIADTQCDFINKNKDGTQIVLNVGTSCLLYSSSIFENNTLYIGKLEIRLSSASETLNDYDKERAKVVFRRLRNWIKKNYWSRLAYLNPAKNHKLTPSRNYWVGPDAKNWKQEADHHILKLSKSSWMIFEMGY